MTSAKSRTTNFKKIVGPALTILFLGLLYWLRIEGFAQTNPGGILTAFILFSALFGGIGSGILSALFSVFYLGWVYFNPAEPLLFAPPEMDKMLSWLGAFTLTIGVCAAFRSRLVDRKSAEKEIADSDTRLKLFLDSVKDYAIFILGLDGRIATWNDGAERITGYSADEIIGQYLNIFYMTKDRREGHAEHILEEASRKGRFESEGWRLKKDGSRFWSNMVLTTMKDEAGNLTGYAIVTRDITERKQHMEELKKAKDVAEQARHAAEQANRAKTHFLANISHEIRTPLGVILGYAELLNSPTQTSSDRQHAISVIKRNGDMLSRIINDLLDLSKIEASRISIEKEWFSLPRLLGDVYNMFVHAAHEKGISLEFDLDGPVPETIQSDPTRLRQILMNLTGNAIKFTEYGLVRVTLGLAKGEKRHELRIVVSDQGPGLSMEQIERLFTPFEQADASLTRRFGGTGLGLALSRRLARALGGDLTLLRSQIGKGSAFSLQVDPGPIENGLLIEHLNLAAEEIEPTPLPVAVPPRLRGLHILVVEDLPDNQMLITRFLTNAGATVDIAQNGREAIEKACGPTGYDVVLMDIQMPEVDGYRATKHLRELHYDRPIIALTAHAMKEERDKSLKMGCDDHLTKPINRDLLVDRVALFAGKRHGDRRIFAV